MGRVSQDTLDKLHTFLDSLPEDAKEKCSLCNKTLTHIVKQAEAQTGAGTRTVTKVLADEINETAAPQDKVSERALTERVRREEGLIDVKHVNSKTAPKKQKSDNPGYDVETWFEPEVRKFYSHYRSDFWEAPLNKEETDVFLALSEIDSNLKGKKLKEVSRLKDLICLALFRAYGLEIANTEKQYNQTGVLSFPTKDNQSACICEVGTLGGEMGGNFSIFLEGKKKK